MAQTTATAAELRLHHLLERNSLTIIGFVGPRAATSAAGAAETKGKRHKERGLQIRRWPPNLSQLL